MSLGMSDEITPFGQKAIIKVVGIGGGGGNAIERMISSGLKDVEFISINTDAQALRKAPDDIQNRVQIGAKITGGLGSGANPDTGREAALEDRETITEMLRGTDMVFLTAGMGGGTGTGATPIVAELAKSCGALTVAIVTLPFSFEGSARMANALKGISALENHVDTLIVVPNDRVAELNRNNNVSFLDAFRQADEVLNNGVRAISELITVSGIINLDFADVRTIMKARGRALMGIATAEGEGRSVRAANEAIVCPLLEKSSIEGATAVIVNIRGGKDMTMAEMQDAVSTVQKASQSDANIIWGVVIDEDERPDIQVTVIAAGFTISKSSINTKKGQVEFEMPQARTAAAPLVKPALQPAPVPAMQEEHQPAGFVDIPQAQERITVAPRFSSGYDSPLPLSKAATSANPSPAEKTETPDTARFEPSSFHDDSSLFEETNQDHGMDDTFEIPAFLRKRKKP